MDLFDDDGPAPQQGSNAPELTVSDLSRDVKRVVEGAFDHVRVRGEVGRVSRPRSGHLYLDLKDDRAVLAAVCWKGVAQRLQVLPEEGMEVVATGRLTTFPGQSRYQLVIDSVAPAGVGALMAMLEKRKRALAAEGLFDPARKRRPPFLPRKIGVVTSPSGAVIRDILHRVADRFPMPVIVWPVAVQGERCAPEVTRAIQGFNALPQGHPLRPDVLIVARGGGSIEDLWGFNEESVARAAAASAIPLISAVGHETDTTLIDHAADLRAPTPTAAAEIAAPVRTELLAGLAGLEERRLRGAARMLSDRRARLRDLSRALPRPETLLSDRAQRLDALGDRLPRALAASVAGRRALAGRGPAARFSPALLTGALARRRDRLEDRGARLAPALSGRARREGERLLALSARLQPGREAERLAARRRQVSELFARLTRARDAETARRRERLAAAGRLLDSVSYRKTLERGFAVVRDETGAVLTDASRAQAGEALRIDLAAGDLSAVVAGPAAQDAPAPAPASGAPRADRPAAGKPAAREAKAPTKARAKTKTGPQAKPGSPRRGGEEDPQGSLF